MISNKQGPRNNIQCFCHAGPSFQMHYLNYDVILHKLVNIINLLFKNSFNKEYGPIIDQPYIRTFLSDMTITLIVL